MWTLITSTGTTSAAPLQTAEPIRQEKVSVGLGLIVESNIAKFANAVQCHD